MNNKTVNLSFLYWFREILLTPLKLPLQIPSRNIQSYSAELNHSLCLVYMEAWVDPFNMVMKRHIHRLPVQTLQSHTNWWIPLYTLSNQKKNYTETKWKKFITTWKKRREPFSSFRRNKAWRGIYRYSLYSTLISILGRSNIENYNFEQLPVIKSVISYVGAREEIFGVPIWRCFRSGRWVVDGNHCSGFLAAQKILKEISAKFSQAEPSSYPEHNHWTTSPFFASCHMNRLIRRQGWGETATRNPSRLGLKSLNFWLNCRLLWPYAAFPHQVEYTLSDLPLPRQLSFYTFKRFMPQLSSFSQTGGLPMWEICCAVSQATWFSTAILWMHF